MRHDSIDICHCFCPEIIATYQDAHKCQSLLRSSFSSAMTINIGFKYTPGSDGTGTLTVPSKKVGYNIFATIQSRSTRTSPSSSEKTPLPKDWKRLDMLIPTLKNVRKHVVFWMPSYGLNWCSSAFSIGQRILQKIMNSCAHGSFWMNGKGILPDG